MGLTSRAASEGGGGARRLSIAVRWPSAAAESVPGARYDNREAGGREAQLPPGGLAAQGESEAAAGRAEA